jgi:hypothetical protein
VSKRTANFLVSVDEFCDHKNTMNMSENIFIVDNFFCSKKGPQCVTDRARETLNTLTSKGIFLAFKH